MNEMLYKVVTDTIREIKAGTARMRQTVEKQEAKGTDLAVDVDAVLAQLYIFMLPLERKINETGRLLHGQARPGDMYTITGNEKDAGDRITRKLEYILSEYPAMKVRNGYKTGESERQFAEAMAEGNPEKAYLAELDIQLSALVDMLNFANPQSRGGVMLAEIGKHGSLSAWSEGTDTRIAADGEYMRDWYLNTHKEA